MLQENLQTTTIDGVIYDTETGECLGTVKPEFHVTDQASAEWVMEKVFSLDAEIAAYEARLKALSENIGAMKRTKEQQRAGILYRFGPEVENFAKENLPKGKKTWTCPYGSVSFRTTQAKLDIADQDRAIVWAKSEAPEAVKVTESILKSMIPADKVNWIMENPTSADANGFTIVPAGESSTIKTGI